MLDHAAIVGHVRDGDYCQTLSFGSFFVILFLDQECSVFGHDLLTKIENIANQSPEISPEDLIKNYAAGNGNLAIAKIEKGQLQLALLGKVSAKIFRNGKIINLSATNGSISGPVAINDLLVLATTDFFTEFTSDLIDPDLTPSEIKDTLAPEIENGNPEKTIAAIFVRIINEEVLNPEFHSKVPEKLLEINPQKKKLLYGIFLFLIIITSLITYQLRSKTLDQKFQSASAIEKTAREELASANKLVGLNDILARQMLTQSRSNLLTQAETAFGKDWQNKKDPAIQKVKTQLSNLDAKLSEVSHIYKGSTLVVFSDLTLLRPNATVSSASLVKGEIVIIDSTNGSIYSVTTSAKTASIVAGSDHFKNPSFVDFSEDKIYVANQTGIFSAVRSNGQASVSQVAKPSDKWSNITGIKVFAGNLYLLDPVANQIWKYQGTDFGFTDLVPYLKTGISVDLSKVVDFSIDGFVYVLSQTGSIVKFSSGSVQDFTITGLDVPFSNPTSIFATDETKNIYILDSGNSRVVVLNKDGVYQSQYIFPVSSIQSPGTTVLADETVKKIFLLSGSKIYSIDLK